MILDEVDVLDRPEERLSILFAFTVEDVDLYEDYPCEGDTSLDLIEVLAVYQDLILVSNRPSKLRTRN